MENWVIGEFFFFAEFVGGKYLFLLEEENIFFCEILPFELDDWLLLLIRGIRRKKEMKSRGKYVHNL